MSVAACSAFSEARTEVDNDSIFPTGIAGTASVDNPARAAELNAPSCACVNKLISSVPRVATCADVSPAKAAADTELRRSEVIAAKFSVESAPN